MVDYRRDPILFIEDLRGGVHRFHRATLQRRLKAGGPWSGGPPGFD